jgi:hypothetical protein
MEIPSVGRDVHYVARGSADGVYASTCRAAKVTEVGSDGQVGLAIFSPDGLLFHPLTKDGGVTYFDRNNPPEGVVYDGPPGCLGWPGSWHWPERDAEKPPANCGCF